MKRFVLLVTLAATTIAAECPGSDDPTGTEGASLVGSWTLQSVNNDPLPSNWNDNGINRVITAGSIVVNTNLGFTYNETADGQNDVTTGTCSLTTPPSTYTCVPTPVQGEQQVNGTAVVNGAAMTLTINDGQVMARVYSRN